MAVLNCSDLLKVGISRLTVTYVFILVKVGYLDLLFSSWLNTCMNTWLLAVGRKIQKKTTHAWYKKRRLPLKRLLFFATLHRLLFGYAALAWPGWLGVVALEPAFAFCLWTIPKTSRNLERNVRTFLSKLPRNFRRKATVANFSRNSGLSREICGSKLPLGHRTGGRAGSRRCLCQLHYYRVDVTPSYWLWLTVELYSQLAV